MRRPGPVSRSAYPKPDELRGLPTGLRITGAIEGTPAAAAEVEPGSLLAGVGGKPIAAPTLRAYCDAATGFVSGDEVTLSIAPPGAKTPQAVPVKLA